MTHGSKWLGVLAAAVLAMALAVAGCGPKSGTGGLSGNVTAVGSTALQPLVEEAAYLFMAKNPGIRISVQGGGSGTGLSQVFGGGADIGNSDIFAEEKDGIDAGQLVDHKVCVTGFALITHPENKVDNLTRQQIKDIFTGKIKNWSEVGGDDRKIVLINRAKGSGTRATFKKYVMDGLEEAPGDAEQESSGTVRKVVSETPGAISYLALPYVDSSMVKALKIDGVDAGLESIASGRYPFWSYEHMYTKGEPQGAVKVFLDYMSGEEVQAGLVEKFGFIPIGAMKVERSAD
ncbi:MAG: phosphate ABC transporter substrate-binding protein [Thermoanaerobacterales bacterium]|nr:phosphate ABC transporter substrate-binding protein [Bacillota bacterium]MDI6905877.1 phosphate ABC transporter substrate-binding protein [Thermoanaerobacterales bacterium]